MSDDNTLPPDEDPRRMGVSSQPPDAPVRPLPIFGTVGHALTAVFSNAQAALAAMVLPVILQLLLGVPSTMIAPTDQAFAELSGGQTLAVSVLMILQIVPYVMLAVAWHRFVLLGPGRGWPPLFPAWEHRHWRFIGYLVLIFIVLVLAGAMAAMIGSLVVGVGIAGAEGAGPVAGIAMGLAILAVVIAIYAASMRLSLVLPAVAVDERFGLWNAWRVSRGQGWRLLLINLILALIMVPLGLIAALLVGLVLMVPVAAFVGFGEQALALVGSLVDPLVGFPVMLTFISVLSIAFRTCTGWVPDGGGEDSLPPTPDLNDHDPDFRP